MTSLLNIISKSFVLLLFMMVTWYALYTIGYSDFYLLNLIALSTCSHFSLYHYYKRADKSQCVPILPILCCFVYFLYHFQQDFISSLYMNKVNVLKYIVFVLVYFVAVMTYRLVLNKEIFRFFSKKVTILIFVIALHVYIVLLIPYSIGTVVKLRHQAFTVNTIDSQLFSYLPIWLFSCEDGECFVPVVNYADLSDITVQVLGFQGKGGNTTYCYIDTVGSELKILCIHNGDITGEIYPDDSWRVGKFVNALSPGSSYVAFDNGIYMTDGSIICTLTDMQLLGWIDHSSALYVHRENKHSTFYRIACRGTTTTRTPLLTTTDDLHVRTACLSPDGQHFAYMIGNTNIITIYNIDRNTAKSAFISHKHYNVVGLEMQWLNNDAVAILSGNGALYIYNIDYQRTIRVSHNWRLVCHFTISQKSELMWSSTSPFCGEKINYYEVPADIL